MNIEAQNPVLRKPYRHAVGRAVFEVTAYVEELFAVLRSYEYDPATVQLIVAGGGGQLIKHFYSYDPAQITILDDLCAAAKGYEYLAYRQLMREA